MRLKTNYFFSIMDKLNELKNVAGKLGLSAEDVVKGWYLNHDVSATFLQNLLGLPQESVFLQPLKAGFFSYEDLTFSEELDCSKRVLGVVARVDVSGRHWLILGLEETRCSWFGAAEWCAGYSFDGVWCDEVFMPTKDEYSKIFDNIEEINPALEKLGKEILHPDERYWTATQKNAYRAVLFCKNSQKSLSGYKHGNYRVRAVWTF